MIDREIKNRENLVLTRFGTIREILYPRKFPAIRYVFHLYIALFSLLFIAFTLWAVALHCCIYISARILLGIVSLIIKKKKKKKKYML